MSQGDGNDAPRRPSGKRDTPARSSRRDGQNKRFSAPQKRGQTGAGLQGSGREGSARGRRQAGGRGRDDAGRRDTGGPRRVDRANRETTEPPGPPIADDVDVRELDKDVRDELSGLPASARKSVAEHLVMATRLIEENPKSALEHALAARERAGRIGVVREAAGVSAYQAGEYAVALRELRAARRLTGSAQHLPLMADSERGLGRPRRALDMAADPAVSGLGPEGRIEMLIVAAGARRDLGEHAAAAVMLQVPELRAQTDEPWLARLRYAYADALEAAGRDEEAERWFASAAEADREGHTDAAERMAQTDTSSSTG